MAIMDRYIDLEDHDKNENSYVIENITDDETPLVPLDEFLATLEQDELEYKKDTEELTNIADSISMLLDKELETRDLMLNPETITLDHVADVRAVITKSVSTVGQTDTFINIDKRDQIAVESMNDPVERIQIAREDIVETLKKMGEFFINIFRKIISWFKKMMAKFVATFNANNARCVRLRKDLVSRSAANPTGIDPDEVRAMFASNPFLGKAWESEGKITKIIDYIHSEKIVHAVNDVIKAVSNVMMLAKDIAVDRNESSQRDVDHAQEVILKNIRDIEKYIKNAFDSKAAGEEDIIHKLGARYNIADTETKDVDVKVPYRMDGKKLKALRIAYNNTAVNEIISKARADNTKVHPAAAILDGLANEFVFEYKHFIELDKDDEEIKKEMPSKLLSYQSLKTIVNKLEKHSKKSPEHCKTVLKNLTNGENLSKSMQQAFKAIAVNDGKSYGTAAMKKACNLGKVAAVDIGVDIILGAIKTQTLVLKIIEDHIKFYDKKKGR